MTIDEAIEEEKEMAKEQKTKYDKCPTRMKYCCEMCFNNPECNEVAEYHEQLAEWLEELKDYRDKNKMVVRVDVENMDSIRDKIEELSKYAESQYNKALDDFKKILTIEKIKEYAESDGYINLNNCSLMIFDIAERLKAGD